MDAGLIEAMGVLAGRLEGLNHRIDDLNARLDRVETRLIKLDDDVRARGLGGGALSGGVVAGVITAVETWWRSSH